jgi:hypothetical protein
MRPARVSWDRNLAAITGKRSNQDISKVVGSPLCFRVMYTAYEQPGFFLLFLTCYHHVTSRYVVIAGNNGQHHKRLNMD